MLIFINPLLIGHELYSFCGNVYHSWEDVAIPEEYVELNTSGFIIEEKTKAHNITYYIYPMRPVLILDYNKGFSVGKQQIEKKGENWPLWVID